MRQKLRLMYENQEIESVKEDFEIGIKFTLFGFIVHPIRKKRFETPIFKDRTKL